MERGKRFIGMYGTEAELLSAVQELKTKGYDDSQIFVVAKSEDDVKMLQRRTDAEIQTTHESLVDKFMDFMTGEDRVRSLMDELGFSDNERAGFYQDVNDGSILLYVEEETGGTGRHKETGVRSGVTEVYGDPAKDGAETWVAPPGDGVNRPSEQPAFGDTTPAVEQGRSERLHSEETRMAYPEYSSAADDTLTNGMEITDFAGELGRDPDEQRRREEFQESVNTDPGLEEQPMRGDFFYERGEGPDDSKKL
ncbi:hypothetical protein NCCP2716_17950 [Sporosarcina sp. NCCP-2716]|uniref:general stress protein n=1 Tax=Sporosarcina sp. NCCP-2716 TaxID=2943679 RepID=UPI002041B9EF|nr:general stress protein [Sporosarcina sp. NCCP-2716]GKV69297.1 hypothetical protein NCCP2716_17950 [Sporosarcina sp. NCCP-2716]